MVGDADELGRGVDVRDEVDARRTRTKMTMRINDLIRINILALSAMPAEARLWFRFWAWGRRARCACGTRRRLGRVAYRDRRRYNARMRRREWWWFDVVSSAHNFLELTNATNGTPPSCGCSSRVTSSLRGRARTTRSSETTTSCRWPGAPSPALQKWGECRIRVA